MTEDVPLAIDLCCGLGGWTEGLLAEGYDVIGFDIEQHVYGEHSYPAQLVLQDVLTLHGSQFHNAALIVASPPCQRYSYMAMPWSRAKAQAAAIRADTSGVMLEDLNRLFNACFRIQREACEAAGHHIPLVVENVKGAQPWVGRARYNFGSFYLWGDVPALMPKAARAQKCPGFRFDGSGQSFQSQSVKVAGLDWSKYGQPGYRAKGFNTTADARLRSTKNKGELVEGRKGAGGKSSIRNRDADVRPSHGNSPSRKFASAMIAKIPNALSRHIARVFHPAA